MSSYCNGYQAALRGCHEASAKLVGVADPRFAEGKALKDADLLSEALGLSLAGKRAMAVLRDIDTSLAVTLTHTGVGAGCVLIMCQDLLRPLVDVGEIAHLSHLLTLAPSSIYECKTYVKIAFNLSEKYDTPVVVYLSEGLLGATTSLDEVEPKTLEDKPYQKNIEKYVTLPSSVRLCAEDRTFRDKRLEEDCNTFPLHDMVIRDKTMGVIAYGETAVEIAAVAPHLSLLRLATIYPIPMDLVNNFAAKVEELVVVEEGDPVVESRLKGAGVKCHGHDLFPLSKHYLPDEIKERLLGVSVPGEETGLPLRSPMFEADHPLLDLFIALKGRGLPVHCDVSLAMLAAEAPLATVDTAFVPNPVAFGNGFATKSPCVSLSRAEEIDGLLASLE
ncbi:MAG: hypothetical protein J5755_04595, partial [Clostridia bacterium]|nr:hypothetical protein [Clostridia bacterium]